MTEILLVTDGFIHPPWLARRAVHTVLAAMPGIELKHIDHLNQLPKIDLSRLQAMVLYYHHKELDDDALAAFEGFVSGGGGVLALHSATASFKSCARYAALLGGSFAGHGPVERFEVQPAATAEVVFSGIGSFAVDDELYLHDLQADLTIHFTALHEGERQPMVWTHEVGAGRVCYIGPGHRTATMKGPQMQELLRQGLAWVLAKEGAS